MKYFHQVELAPLAAPISEPPRALQSAPKSHLSRHRSALTRMLALSALGALAVGPLAPAWADATIEGPGTAAQPGDGAKVTLTPPLNNEGVTGGANNVTVEIVDQSSAGISTSGQPGIVLGDNATVSVGAAGQVVTQGDNARGIDLGNIAKVTLNGNVSTSGEESGALITGTGSTIDINGTVRTGGGNSAAVTAGANSTVNVNTDADVRTGNSNSSGVLLQGEGTTLNVNEGALVTTSSGQSNPVLATGNNATVNVAGDVRSSSGNSDAIRIEGDNGQVTVSQGGFVTAQSSGSDAIDMVGSGGTVTVQQGGEVRISSGNSVGIRGGAMGMVNVAGTVGISSSDSQGVVLGDMGTLNVQEGGIIETSSSESQAVQIAEDATSATVNVNQGGTIDAVGAQAILDAGETNSTIKVQGKIFGGSSDPIIDLGAGNDEITISGEGQVEATSANPVISLGAGDDTATLSGPDSVKGSGVLVAGDEGNDTVNLGAESDGGGGTGGTEAGSQSGTATTTANMTASGGFTSDQFTGVETVNVSQGNQYSVNDAQDEQTVNVNGQNSAASVDEGGSVQMLNSNNGGMGSVNQGGRAETTNSDGMNSSTSVGEGGSVGEANSSNGGSTQVDGGEVENANANMGGTTDVNNGGQVNNANSSMGGSTNINEGGNADNATSDGMGSSTNVNNGGQVNNSNANNGGQTNVNEGGNAQNANSDGAGSSTNVNNGGTVGSANSSNGGATNVNQGGRADNTNSDGAGSSTNVGQGGSVGNANASNGGATQVNNGGQVDQANSDGGGRTDVNQGGNVNNANAGNGGSTNVNNGGRVTNNSTGQGGTTNVNDGGRVDASTTENGGTTNVNSGGRADGIRSNAGGTVNVNSGAQGNLENGPGGGGNINFGNGSSTDVQAQATGLAQDNRPTAGVNYDAGTRVNVLGSPFFTGSATSDTVTLTRGPNAFENFANGRNQRAVARALDQIGATGNNPVVAGLVLTQTPQISRTFDRLNGELVASTALGLANAARAYTDIMLRRTSINGFAPQTGATPYTMDSRAEEISGVAPDGTVLVGSEVKTGPQFWFGAFGRDTRVDRDAGGQGFDADSVGGALGAEFTLGRGTVGGLSLGYSTGNVNVRGLGDNADVDSVHAGAYVGSRRGNLNLGLALGYGNHNSDTRRTVQNASGLQGTTGSFDGQTYSVSAEAAYNMTPRKSLSLAPLVTFKAVRVDGDFDETGAGNFDLRGDVSDTLVFGGLGVQLAGQFGNQTRVRPTARLLYERAFSGDIDATNRFRGAAGNGFGVVGFGGGQDRVRAGLGLDIATGNRTGFNISAEVINGSNIRSYGGAARFIVSF